MRYACSPSNKPSVTTELHCRCCSNCMHRLQASGSCCRTGHQKSSMLRSKTDITAVLECGQNCEHACKALQPCKRQHCVLSACCIQMVMAGVLIHGHAWQPAAQSHQAARDMSFAITCFGMCEVQQRDTTMVHECCLPSKHLFQDEFVMQCLQQE